MLFCVLGYGFFGEIELHFSLSLHQAIIFQFPTMLASLEMHVEWLCHLSLFALLYMVKAYDPLIVVGVRDSI